jgi:hypothetical protein
MFIVTFVYSYCYICNILCILYHYVVCAKLLLPPGVNPVEVNRSIKCIKNWYSRTEFVISHSTILAEVSSLRGAK